VLSTIIKLAVAAALAVTTPALAGSTEQRDAPTTRFYDARGKSTGSASTYGNTTKFYDERGNLIGSMQRMQRGPRS
jgi:YD repeat-containing protein